MRHVVSISVGFALALSILAPQGAQAASCGPVQTFQSAVLIGCEYAGDIGFTGIPSSSNPVLGIAPTGSVLASIPATGSFVLLDVKKADLEKYQGDRFSALWGGVFTFSSGVYKFTLSSVDDDAVVKVDSVVVASDWKGAIIPPQEVQLTEGSHRVEVVYYENTGNSSLKLTGQRLRALPLPTQPSGGGSTGSGGSTPPATSTPTPSSSGSLANISFSPSSVSFGDVAIGQTTTRSITFTNNNLVSISSTPVVTGSGFSCENQQCPSLTVAKGQSVQIRITFAPQSAGLATGQIQVSSTSSAVATLGGTGFAPASQGASGSGTSISLGGQRGIIYIDNPLKQDSFSEVLIAVVNFIFTAALAVSPFMILYAGFLFVTGGGNPEQITRGRNVLIWTFVGLIVIILSRGLIAILQGILGV